MIYKSHAELNTIGKKRVWACGYEMIILPDGSIKENKIKPIRGTVNWKERLFYPLDEEGKNNPDGEPMSIVLDLWRFSDTREECIAEYIECHNRVKQRLLYYLDTVVADIQSIE